MPTRLLRDWTDSEAVNALSAEAERFFVRLIQKADDFGRYTGDPKLLRPYLFPLLLDSTREVSLERWIAECVKVRLVRRYEVGGKPYVVIEKFGQRLKRKPDGSLMVKAKYPPPAGKPPDWMPESGDFPALPGSSGQCLLEAESEANAEAESEARVPRARGKIPPPTEEEWAAYSRATWPDWPEWDIRAAWASYEKRGWKGVTKWKAAARHCYYRQAGERAGRMARILVGAHPPAPERKRRVVTPEGPAWVVGVLKASGHPARPVVPPDLDAEFEAWMAGSRADFPEPPEWRPRLEAALEEAIAEDRRLTATGGK